MAGMSASRLIGIVLTVFWILLALVAVVGELLGVRRKKGKRG